LRQWNFSLACATLIGLRENKSLSSESEDLVDVSELRVEAEDARYLASTSKDRAAIADLLNYAAALERDASRWEDVHRTSVGRSVLGYFSSWWSIFTPTGQH
jgi:hypothetical protein